MTQEERRERLIQMLLAEGGAGGGVKIPPGEEDRKRLLRALLNVRPPGEADPALLSLQDEYLQEEIRRKGITDLSDLTPVRENLYLWRGDITTLRCGAIVNAANAAMLGCFYPNHGCIDNAIHTYAGLELRAACADLMNRQGHEEPTGGAKITPAFNLPCRYVIHTVGPVVRGRLTGQDERDLASCYLSCLRLADRCGVGSAAFCCISTGEFHFPHRRAAEIAVRTVEEYRKESGSSLKVIFNVFKEEDDEIYRQILIAD